MTAAFFDGEDFTVKVVFVDEVKGLEVGIEGMLGIEGIAGIEGVYGESVECRDEATSDCNGRRRRLLVFVRMRHINALLVCVTTTYHLVGDGIDGIHATDGSV